MSGQIVRECETIEEEMTRLMEEYRAMRSQDDETAHSLIVQKGYNQDYQEDVSYFKEFWRYYILNELSIKKINELHEQNQRLSDLASSVDLLQQEMQMALSQRYKKKNRRTSQEIEKTYQCPYEKCNKLYGSDVSLNLHIKLKHQGGNKTDREKVAKLIVQAQERGEDVPNAKINIQFPPGYLDQFKKQWKQDKPHRLVAKTHKRCSHTIFYED